MKKSILSILTVVTLTCSLVFSASASLITFDLSIGVDEQTSFAKTVSGITLTFLNPSARTAFKGDADGLALGNQGAFILGAPLTSFQLSVLGGTLQFKGYEITFAQSPNASFSLAGGSGASNNNLLNSLATYPADGNWTIAPGQTGTLTATGFSGVEMAQLHTLTFDILANPVPEPSTYALLCISLGVVGYARRKSRKNN